MKYAAISVLIVVAALGGLFIMVDSDTADDANNGDGTGGIGGTATQQASEQQFQPLPEISRPDYETVVTDDALRAELTAEAQEYIDSITADADAAAARLAEQQLALAESQGTGQMALDGAAGQNSETSNAAESGGAGNGYAPGGSNGEAGASSNAASDLSQFGVSLGSVAQQGGVRLYTINSEIEIDGETVTIKKLLERHGRQPVRGGIYYVHRVSNDDTQGVWGVIQGGLIKRFGDGVAEKRAADQEKYSVLIPENADERLPNGLSSFLGKVIHYKVSDSEVFTKSAGLMKNNKDIIYPGDDVVIVMFKPSELISVYQYFATRGITGSVD